VSGNSHNGNAGRANAGNPVPAQQPAGQEIATVKNGNLASAANANLAY